MKAQRSNDSTVASAVRKGLVESAQKRLPQRLLRDEEGLRLLELVRASPEYYRARLEASILLEHADDIAGAVLTPMRRVNVVELYSGVATASRLLVRALVPYQGTTLYLPVEAAMLREPTFLGRLVLWLGGGLDDDEDLEATLRMLRGSVATGGALLLAADHQQDVELMLGAHLDRGGANAAFQKNVLIRINRELGGAFDPSTFAHRARWNPGTAAVEMHLESLYDQRVPIRSLGATVSFARGESIHTASSVTYDDRRLERLSAATGFAPERAFYDVSQGYALHLWRAV